MSFNKFPWTNFHGFNLDWVIEKVKECVAAVESFAEEIANIGATYETKQNITSVRKLSPTGNFTGTWKGKAFENVFGKVNTNTAMIEYLTAQFSDGRTGFVIDGGFFEETGIKANYNGGAF
jgi:hypothetical protein